MSREGESQDSHRCLWLASSSRCLHVSSSAASFLSLFVFLFDPVSFFFSSTLLSSLPCSLTSSFSISASSHNHNLHTQHLRSLSLSHFRTGPSLQSISIITMAENSQVSAPPSVALNYPLALLWSYEFRRQNGILTSRLLDIKDQLNATEQLNEWLSKVLNNLIVIIASMVTVVANRCDGAEHRIRLLHRLLGQALVPLYRYHTHFDLGNQTLIDCIAQLEALHDLPAISFDGDQVNSANSPSTALSKASDSPSGSPRSAHASAQTGHLRSGSTTCSEDDEPVSPAEAREALMTKLDAVMHQEGRPLEDYFDAACDFRRDQIRLRQADDALFIEAFLAGCDNRLYRRRLTHALRKNGWYWTWLTHEVQYLILEQEYMDKQSYALEHVMPDGSFMWPDGTCKHRIVVLQPITEEDLTDSEPESDEK